MRVLPPALRLAVIATWASLLSCRTAQAPATTDGPARAAQAAPDPAALLVVDVGSRCSWVLDTQQWACDPHELGQLHWRGPYGQSGSLFALLDNAGYAGLVRLGQGHDCDDCPGPHVQTQLVEGRGPPRGSIEVQREWSAVAVGPVKAALPRARVLALPGKSYPTAPAWEPRFRVDLEGDGAWDLEAVQRCGGETRPGCDEFVCDEFCRGVRTLQPTPSEVRHMHCEAFIPDAVPCTQSGDGS